MFRSMALILALLSSSSAFASSNFGKITGVLMGPTYGKTVMIQIDGSPTFPACKTNGGLAYAFDATTDAGKVTLALALSLYVSGKSAQFTGATPAGSATACTIYPGIEDLGSISAQ